MKKERETKKKVKREKFASSTQMAIDGKKKKNGKNFSNLMFDSDIYLPVAASGVLPPPPQEERPRPPPRPRGVSLVR